MAGWTRLFLLGFLLCLCCTNGAVAHPRGPNARYVVQVEDASGHELPTFHHAGQTFVLGHFGERYNVRVQNHTSRRVEAVVSVDGRDVVSGNVGDFVQERGYLVDPYGELVIEGFRQSYEQVAAFRFTSPQGSYSARMGTPENVGVIGVAIFPERAAEIIPRRVLPQAAPPAKYERRDYSHSAPSASATAEDKQKSAGASSRSYGDLGAARERASAEPSPAAAAPAPSTDNLGTAYGESMQSSVQETWFARADRTHPTEVISLRYDDHDGLIARGIVVDPPSPAPHYPQAFPHNTRFAPPPPVWD